jgi:hypothetical protein
MQKVTAAIHCGHAVSFHPVQRFGEHAEEWQTSVK